MAWLATDGCAEFTASLLRQASAWRMPPWHTPGLHRAMCACLEEPWPSLLSRRRVRCSACWLPKTRTSAPHRSFAFRRELRATKPTANCRDCRCRYRCHGDNQLVGVFRPWVGSVNEGSAKPWRRSTCRICRQGTAPLFRCKPLVETPGGPVILHQGQRRIVNVLPFGLNRIAVSSFRQTSGHRTSCQVRLQRRPPSPQPGLPRRQMP